MSDYNDQEFNSLNEDKQFDLFDRFFPDKWVTMDNLKEKEKILLDSISDNKIITLPASKLTLSN